MALRRRPRPRGRKRKREPSAAVRERLDTEPELVLYRCPTPTDILCPCGAVARRLRRLGLAYRTERVPYRRADRPEIVELTGQKRVPLLIDADEIVYDSRRIHEYLDWRYGGDEDGPPDAAPDPA